jgi:FixJ family two-component response regulator
MHSADSVVFDVDDDACIRSAISRLLRTAGIHATCFASALEFLKCSLPDGPSCLVLDVILPGTNGLELQRLLREANMAIPIVFITGHADIATTVRAMKAGAIEFLAKPFGGQELLDAIQSALAHASTLHGERTQLNALRSRFNSMTRREQQVFDLVVEGKLNKQIAADLGITEVTVKIHRSRVMQKMQASSLPDLVRMSARLPHSTQ